jgi:DNA-binding CsgD family transcriptional regulator
MDTFEDSAGTCTTLTNAELQVLTWLRVGRTNREIGQILCKSEFTVKTHVQRMLAKTGLDNRLQLALLARPRSDREDQSF